MTAVSRPAGRVLVIGSLGVALLAGCAESPAAEGPAPSAPPVSSGLGTPSGPPSSAPASVPSDPAPAGPDRLTIVVTGDVLLHERLWVSARADGRGRFDFAPMLAAVRPLVSGADLAVCHLETPLAPPGGPFRGYPRFSVPPQIATALRQTGYDACTTASNHSFDAGAAGVDRTLDALDSAGIRHAGTARTAAEAAAPALVDVRGVKVALLSYAYGFNGLPYPGGETWRANLLDAARVHADAGRARAAGADIVVLACQWGDEYVQRPNRQQLTLAREFVADSNIDLVYGHHAHVVQPVERIGGKWVAYGLANLVAAHREPGTTKAEGLLARFTFSRGADGRWSAPKAEYAALLVTDTVPVRVVDVRRGLAAAPTQRLRLAQRRTDTAVHSRGSGATPITG